MDHRDQPERVPHPWIRQTPHRAEAANDISNAPRVLRGDGRKKSVAPRHHSPLDKNVPSDMNMDSVLPAR